MNVPSTRIAALVRTKRGRAELALFKHGQNSQALALMTESRPISSAVQQVYEQPKGTLTLIPIDLYPHAALGLASLL